MADLFDPDFQEFIRLPNKNEVKYSLVGGHAVIIHGHVRYKGDINLWAEATDKNYLRLIKNLLSVQNATIWHDQTEIPVN